YFEKGVVLTNSELLGMATKDSPPPSKVEVVYHPGKPDEHTYAADVMSVEPAVKVAVLKLRGESLPEPPRPPVALAQAPSPPSPMVPREIVKGTPAPARAVAITDAVERAQKAAVLVRV